MMVNEYVQNIERRVWWTELCPWTSHVVITIAKQIHRLVKRQSGIFQELIMCLVISIVTIPRRRTRRIERGIGILTINFVVSQWMLLLFWVVGYNTYGGLSGDGSGEKSKSTGSCGLFAAWVGCAGSVRSEQTLDRRARGESWVTIDSSS